MKPSERDLHLAMELANSVIFDWEPEDHPADYENLGNDIANKVAVLLAAERMSLPKSALEEIDMAISYLQTAVKLCEQLHEHVGDHDASYISLSGELEQTHDDLKEELEKIRRWQKDGPEPRKEE